MSKFTSNGLSEIESKALVDMWTPETSLDLDIDINAKQAQLMADYLNYNGISGDVDSINKVKCKSKPCWVAGDSAMLCGIPVKIIALHDDYAWVSHLDGTLETVIKAWLDEVVHEIP